MVSLVQLGEICLEFGNHVFVHRNLECHLAVVVAVGGNDIGGARVSLVSLVCLVSLLCLFLCLNLCLSHCLLYSLPSVHFHSIFWWGLSSVPGQVELAVSLFLLLGLLWTCCQSQ